MPAFHHRLRVRYSDCDPQGVLFNANYLTYFDIAITELWREAIGPYGEVMGEHGIDLVVAEATIRYRAPIRFDEEVDLATEISGRGTTSMTTRIEFEGASGLAAEGEMRHVFIRHGTAEKTPIPADIRDALSQFGA